MIEDTEEALGALESITSNQEDIGVDELGVTTILLEVLTESAGQDTNVGIFDTTMIIGSQTLSITEY